MYAPCDVTFPSPIGLADKFIGKAALTVMSLMDHTRQAQYRNIATDVANVANGNEPSEKAAKLVSQLIAARSERRDTMLSTTGLADLAHRRAAAIARRAHDRAVS